MFSRLPKFHHAILATALVSLSAGSPEPAGARTCHGKHRSSRDFTLTILHNNDGESSLTPFVIDGVEYGGIAQFKSKVDQLRRGAQRGGRGVVLLNSGDNFLAGTTFAASRQAGAPFYDALAVRLLGYDALAVGNHEFDFGPAVFGEFVDAVNRGRVVPFVSANLDYSADTTLSSKVGRDLVTSTIVYERGERIGVVGLTTPTLPTISSPVTVQMSPDLVNSAQAQVDRLTARGVNKIVMISHLQGLASELALVSSLRDVDIVIGGGGDEILGDSNTVFFPGDEQFVSGAYPQVALDSQGVEVPVVTTPGNYKYVGQLVVSFDRRGELTGWEDNSGIQLVAGVSPDRFAERFIEAPVAAFVAGLTAQVIGVTEVNLDCERSEVRGFESNCGNLMADSLLAAARARAAQFGLPDPDVAFQNGGGIRGEIDQPVGVFSEADTFRLAPFANFVALAVAVPAETFRQILEEGATALPDGRDGAFVQAAGFSYVVDVSFPARQTQSDGVELAPGQRVRRVVLDDGTILVADGVAADLTVNVASNDFSLAGGDAYPAVPFTRLGVSYQQALSDYISNELGGVISTTQYPAGGEGRITIE